MQKSLTKPRKKEKRVKKVNEEGKIFMYGQANRLYKTKYTHLKNFKKAKYLYKQKKG